VDQVFSFVDILNWWRRFSHL